MKNIRIIAFGFLFLTVNAFAQSKSKQNMATLIDEQMRFANEQYKVLAKNTPADRMPKSLKDNKVESSDTKWWCSGFYSGSLLYIYEYTQDAETKAEINRRLGVLEKEKHYTGNHDLGFMMYCSFGNAYRIFKKAEYKRTIDTAAMSLSTRYRPSIKVIQSWNSSKNFKCPVIIDNMMNLELLCWVTDNGGDAKFKDIAINHANTTLATHFRPDYSSYHVLDYNLETAKLERKVTHQGFSDESAWARGQAWGLYGYITMYRFTKDARYLTLAKNITAYLLNHPNKTADLIPYWDYNAPNIPNALRDASAGAITASALLELGQYVSKKEKKKYVETAEMMIRTLASNAYRAKLGENGGFLLMHSVGHFPNQTEVDVPLSYADYYFLEALHRYKEWYLKK
jgi:unsaturated chondroitin disaccharide hydrolase